jgi:hypothetical protein
LILFSDFLCVLLLNCIIFIIAINININININILSLSLIKIDIYNINTISQYYDIINMEYKFISPIKLNYVYDFETKEVLTHDIQLGVIKTTSNILYFIKEHPELLSYLLPLLKFEQLLIIYNNNKLLYNYWSEEKINYIVDLNKKNIMIELLNYQNNNDREQILLSHFIKLNDSFNFLYNFTQKVMGERLNNIFTKIQNKNKDINLNNFWIGDSLLHIANNKFYTNWKNKNKNNILYLYLFSKQNKINTNIEQNNNLYYDDKNYYFNFQQEENIIVIIPKNIFVSQYDLIAHNNNIILDKDKNIYCTADLYQKLILNLNLNLNLDINLKNKWQYQTIKFKNNFNILSTNLENISHRCYHCKKIYNANIYYNDYINMCLDCAEFHYYKKIAKADLKNSIAFVTGIRQKIGLEVALKLLRCGATVIGTSRFPHLSWYNYNKEHDFEEWKNRLIIYECNFLKLEEVNNLITKLKNYNINFVINNACQTIRPSQEYKEKIIKIENLLKDNCQYQIRDIQNQNNNLCRDLILINNNDIPKIYHYENKYELVQKYTDIGIKFNQFNDIKVAKYDSS